MPRTNSYRDLIVWQRAVQLAVESYGCCSSLPRDERFELSAQIRRASISIAANIAEGSGRRTPKDVDRFLSVARGSLRELETLWLIAVELGYVTRELIARTLSLADEVGRMLTAFHKSLRA